MGNSMSSPIYMQIIEKFKFQISSGILQPNEKLPSVRELALIMTVNPNTIQRAYRELEDMGYIVTIPGKGNYVAEDVLKSINKTIEEEYNNIFDSIIRLEKLGCKRDDILKMIKKGRG